MGNKMDKVIFPTSDYIEISPPTKSLCGSIASFSDGGNAPIPSLTASIVPVQDLHGYDSPWVGGAGKNKLENATSLGTRTINGVTITTREDGSLLFNGTSTGGVNFIINNNVQLPNNTYILSTDATMPTNSIIAVNTSNGNKSTRDSVTFTGSVNGNVWIYVGQEGVVFNNLIIKPMIRLASDSDSTFAPYSNICPISGWTEEVITVSPLNLQLYNGQIYGDGSWVPSDMRLTNASSEQDNSYFLKAGTYTLDYDKLNPNAPNLLQCSVLTKDDNYTIIDNFANKWNGLPFTFTLTQDGYLYFTMRKNANTNVNPSDYKAKILGHTTTIPFTDSQGNPVEVYGGSVDVVSGGGISDTIKWTVTPTANQIPSFDLHSCMVQIPTEKVPNSYNVNVNKCLCDKLRPSNYSAQFDNHIHFPNTSLIAFYLEDEVGTTKQDWVDYFAQAQITVCYKLETPTTFYTQPTSIKSLDGENNVFASTGDVCVTYVTQEYQDLTVNFAATASKLGSSNVGSATQPIYLNGGTATACTYTLGKSVPSDAVFTDTNTNVTQTATSTNANYEILFSGTADNTTRTEGVGKDDNLRYNPSSNTLQLRNTGTSSSITPSSISLSNSSGGVISIDNTNNKIEIGKSGTSITYSNTDVVTSNGNTWDGANTSLKDAIANIIDLLHPVGSIYMSLTDSTVAEVEAKFGGTWEKIESRFLLAASSSYAVNSTGGSANAVVVSHTHPLNGTNAKTSDQAAHTHPLNGTNAKAVDVGGHTHTEYAGINEATSGLFTSITGTRSYPNTHIIGGAGKTSSNGGHGHSLTGNTSTGGAHSHTLSGNTGAASDGESGTGKNMPPYLAVYMYKRTA